MQAAVIHFAPPEDQRINVTAKLGVPRPGAYAAGSPTKPPAAGGSLTLRWQPSPDVPYTFFDVKARTRGASSAAAVRGCLFDPRSNVAVWAEMPVAATNANGSPAASPGAGLRLGAKYASPDLSVGAVINPAQATLSHAFVVSWRGVAWSARGQSQAGTGGWQERTVLRLFSWQGVPFVAATGLPTTAWSAPHSPLQVGRVGGLLLGAQTAPMLQLDSLFAGGGLLDRPAWATAARQCQLATSYAVAYQPTPGAGTYGGRFTAAVELVRTGLRGVLGCAQLSKRGAACTSVCGHIARAGRLSLLPWAGAGPRAVHLIPAPPGGAAACAQSLRVVG